MFTLNCKGRLLTIEQPIVMGILNVTPDSFYSGSRVSDADLVSKAEAMLAEGATILDIGGQSTRPGSERVGREEELQRVLPAIEQVQRCLPGAFISVDTYDSEVATKAVAAGACIVNDVSGGTMDEAMIRTAAGLRVPYVCMHMKGTPADMQEHAQYDDIGREVLDFLIKKTAECATAGILDVIIDPGF